MSLQQLLEIAFPLPPPIDAGRAEQWKEVEAALKTQLPSDYKNLVSNYGVGYFGNYVTVLNPFYPEHQYPSILALYKKSYEMLHENRQEWDCPYPFFPEAKGLLPWGKDDTAGLLCWLTVGSPDTWQTVVLNSNWQVCEEYPMTATEFLFSWLTRQVAPSFYPLECYPFHEPLFRHEIDYSLFDINAVLNGDLPLG